MLKTYDLRDFVDAAHASIEISGTLTCPEAAAARVKIFPIGSARALRDYRISLTAERFAGSVNIGMGPGTGSCVIASAGPLNATVNMWRGATVTIGEQTTMNSARTIADNADIVIGRDNLWSDEIIVQSNDQHGIVDLATDVLLGQHRRRIAFGDHVWIGRRCIVMPDVTLGAGCIVGAGSVVTKSVDPFTVAAGSPARGLRRDTTWSRSPEGFTAEERAWVAAHRPPAPRAKRRFGLW